MSEQKEYYRNNSDAMDYLEKDALDGEATLSDRNRHLDEMSQSGGVNINLLVQDRRTLLMNRAKLALEQACVHDIAQYLKLRKIDPVDDTFLFKYHVLNSDINQSISEADVKNVAGVLLETSSGPNNGQPKNKILLEFPQTELISLMENAEINKLMSRINDIPEVVITMSRYIPEAGQYDKSVFHVYGNGTNFINPNGSVVVAKAEQEVSILRDLFLSISDMTLSHQRAEYI